MPTDNTDINNLILDQLRKISEEVRCIPKLQAQVESLHDVTQKLTIAMNEITGKFQAQAETYSKRIGEVQTDIQRAVAGITLVNVAMTDLGRRVKDLESQVRASFTQQQSLARDIRDVEDRDNASVLAKHIADSEVFEDKVDEMTVAMKDLVEKIKEFPEFLPWLRGLRWFLRILFYALAAAVVTGVLWLLGQALIGGL